MLKKTNKIEVNRILKIFLIIVFLSMFFYVPVMAINVIVNPYADKKLADLKTDWNTQINKAKTEGYNEQTAKNLIQILEAVNMKANKHLSGEDDGENFTVTNATYRDFIDNTLKKDINVLQKNQPLYYNALNSKPEIPDSMKNDPNISGR